MPSTHIVRFVADAIAEGIDAVERGDREPAVVVARRLAEPLRSPSVAVGHADYVTGKAEFSAWGVVNKPLLVRAALTRPGDHPILRHWRSGAVDTTAVSVLVRADQSAWQRSTACEISRRAIGFAETSAIRLDSGTATVHLVAFARDRDYSAADLELLDDAKPPVVALQRHADHLRRVEESCGRAAREVAGDVGITSREHEVLYLLATGLLATSIATRLAISPRTVHRHLHSLYDKLDSHDRLTAVIRAQALGLLGRDTGGESVTA
ncbi:helix-turn-helix transcriptional regulator [uncultured Microbacterium sp.]|uniref:helix-turn-helix transcriptional regulator n=1 Tax=uncultured Microbacterium sp. TaxID=191216 RepID=UPI0026023F8E|nr:helix-turn-helix transcriptional regulator [uncultured Microbacterium sp.]